MTVATLTPAKPLVLRAWYLTAIVPILLVVGAARYFKEEKKVDVLTAKVGYEDVSATVSANGTVVPIDDYPARAAFTGQVDKIYVHLGQKVRPGDPLLHMKDQYAASRLESARAALLETEVSNENVEHNGSKEDQIAFNADLQHARAEQESASSALATLKQLQAIGSASDAEIAAASQRLDAAQTSLGALKERTNNRYSETDRLSWKARLAAQRAALQAEQVSYANSNLTAPVSGTVYILPVALYDFVPAGGDMLHIADFSKLHINADFYEADAAQLRVGQPVKITWDGSSKRSWQGKVVAKPLALSGAGAFRTGRSIIEFNDQAGDIPVNTIVTVVVTTATHSHVIAIPREALQSDGDDRFVFSVVSGMLKRVPVRVGIVNAMQAEITDGLKPNDTITLRSLGDQKMKEGVGVIEDRKE
jgi:HlyD family secretion protein